jgi:hypothetical protein
MMEVYILGLDEKYYPVNFWEVWVKELMVSFKSRKKIIQGNIENTSIQEDVKLWEAFFNLAYREFSSLSESNANDILAHLDCIQRSFEAENFLDQMCKFLFSSLLALPELNHAECN